MADSERVSLLYVSIYTPYNASVYNDFIRYNAPIEHIRKTSAHQLSELDTILKISFIQAKSSNNLVSGPIFQTPCELPISPLQQGGWIDLRTDAYGWKNKFLRSPLGTIPQKFITRIDLGCFSN